MGQNAARCIAAVGYRPCALLRRLHSYWRPSWARCRAMPRPGLRSSSATAATKMLRSCRTRPMTPAASPERLGFSVRRVINGIFDHMRRALRDFAPQARGREMAVVYFAGHGMEIAGANWLIPVDAELKMDIAPHHQATSPLSAAEEQAPKAKD